MSSILIVDDEELVRNAIIETIDFDSIGFHEVWEAEDGELAYDIVCERHPDIVMTDIRMPFMDGLELSEKVKSNYPNTKIIILTGHDEFEYAKKALQLGVTDYIVKPIKPSELTALLKNAADSLEAERKARLEQSKLKRQLRESLPLLQERALNSAILGNTADLKQKLNYLDMDICSKKSYTVLAMDLNPLGAEPFDQESAAPRAKELISRALKDRGVVFSDMDRKIVVIMFDTDVSDPGEREKLHEFISGLRESINGRLKAACACGIGCSVDSVEKLPETYEEAVHALGYMAGKGNNMTFDWEQENWGVKFTYPKEQVAELIGMVELNMPYESALDSLIGTLNENVISVDNLRLVYTDIINAIHKILLFTEVEIPKDLLISDSRSIKSVEEMKAQLYETLKTTSGLLENIKISRKRLIVENAKAFIEAHYDNPDLNLNLVAKEVFVSPSYLSMLFKKEAGESFVDYMTSVRMEAAKQIIRKYDLKTYEVALRVGYRDPHYFGVSFKKYAGLTPSEYKKLQP